VGCKEGRGRREKPSQKTKKRGISITKGTKGEILFVPFALFAFLKESARRRPTPKRFDLFLKTPAAGIGFPQANLYRARLLRVLHY
jgi:hypothetical protein